MLAIIPARGGSKGLPGKNIKLLNGKPLIWYTINAAVSSSNIDEIFVSTDDPEIASIAEKFGVNSFPLRPKELATDTSKSIDVYNFVLDQFRLRNKEFDEIIILQPTSPLRTTQHIDEAVSLFRARNAESVVSYCEEDHPISWHKYVGKEGEIISIFESQSTNRQEERTSFFPNGAIYIFKSELLNRGDYYSNNSYAYIMGKDYSIDIDNQRDFEYVEYLLTKKI